MLIGFKKFFSLLISFIFLFSCQKFDVCGVSKDAITYNETGTEINKIEDQGLGKANSSCWCVFKWIAIGLGVYLCLNVLVRVLTKIALFWGSLKSVDEENVPSYRNGVRFENIIDEVSGKVIGRKFWCDTPIDHDLKDISVIFFNGNGGSVLNDNMHLGPDGKMIYLTQKGAIVYAIDHRGYGNRKKFLAPLSMSESTIFKDGEDAFNYVRSKTTGKGKKIVVAGYSLGGGVTMHVWNYAQKEGLEHELAGIILHSPLNNFNKVAGKIFKPLEWLLNFMFINLKDFKEFEKLKGTKVPSYWYSGFTKDGSEFVDLRTTLCGNNSSKNVLIGDAKKEVSDKLRNKGINNAITVMDDFSHKDGYGMKPSTVGERNEVNKFKKFLSNISRTGNTNSSKTKEMKKFVNFEGKNKYLIAS